MVKIILPELSSSSFSFRSLNSFPPLKQERINTLKYSHSQNFKHAYLTRDPVPLFARPDVWESPVRISKQMSSKQTS